MCIRPKDSKNLHYSTNYRNDSLKHCGKYHLLISFLLLSHPIPFFHSQALLSHNFLCNLETHLDPSQLHLTLQMLVCASSLAATKALWAQFHPVEFCSHTCSRGSRPERNNPNPSLEIWHKKRLQKCWKKKKFLLNTCPKATASRKAWQNSQKLWWLPAWE